MLAFTQILGPTIWLLQTCKWNTNKCHRQQDPVTVLHGAPSHEKGGGDLEDEHPREEDVQSRELDEVGDIPARRWV